MRGQVYPHEVFTDVPAYVSDKIGASVMRELMRWCTEHCDGRYAVMTADSESREAGGQRLAIQFEVEEDAARFTERFG